MRSRTKHCIMFISSPSYDQILLQPVVKEPGLLQHCEATVAATSLLWDLPGSINENHEIGKQANNREK